MSCGVLNTGYDYECDDARGGIKQGSILIGRFEEVGTATITAGVVTALPQTASTYFYRYKAKKQIAGATTTEIHDPKVGTTDYETVLQTYLNKMSGAKNIELQLLVSKPVVVIYQDNNDKYFIMGLTNGAEKMGGENGSGTGTNFADPNRYSIAFTSNEGNYPYEVNSSVIATLQIDPDVS